MRRGMSNKFFILSCIVFLLFMGCGNTTSSESSVSGSDSVPAMPEFNADSAYSFVERQCAFGPRVPGTDAHAECLTWMVSEFRRFGADTVLVQEGSAKIYNGVTKPVRNVIVSFNLASDRRLLFCAHWDSRPFADNELLAENRKRAILGADDGASGVGVLMELARILGSNPPSVGVDIIFFDLEDWGAPEWEHSVLPNGEDWCLGSRYWALHRHVPGYRPEYAVLLDMVGGNDERFYREYFSERNAKWLNDLVWGQASDLGFSSRFVNELGGAITDDHLPLYDIASISSIDIVAFSQNRDNGFPEYWHTLGDDMSNISKSTLSDVGTLIVSLIY